MNSTQRLHITKLWFVSLAVVMFLSNISIGIVAQDADTLWTHKVGASAVNSVRFSYRGASIGVGDSSGRLTLLNAVNGVVVRSFIAHPGPISAVRFSPLDSNLMVTAGSDGAVQEWTISSGEKAGEYYATPIAPVTSVDLGSDAHTDYLVSGYAPPATDIRIWKTTTHQPLLNIPVAAGGVRCVGLDQHEYYVAYCLNDSLMRIVALGRSNQLNLNSQSSWINSFAFGNGGQLLAAACSNGAVRIWEGKPYKELFDYWETPSGKPVIDLIGHSAAVTGVAFTSNSKYLISCGLDSTVRVWSVATGENVYTYHYPSAQLCVAVYGDYIATGAADGAVIVWKLKIGSGAQLPTPILIAPDSNAVNQSREPVLRWHAVTAALTYSVQATTDPSFTGAFAFVADAVVDTFIRVPQLDPTTTYFWRVRAYGSGALSPWSVSWRFTTGTGGPAPPLQLAPPNHAGYEPTTDTLRWRPAPGATAYRVQLTSFDTLFTQALLLDETVSDTFTVVSGLDPYAVYYWRVRAENDVGAGVWSSIWWFATNIKLSVDDRRGDMASRARIAVIPNPVGSRATVRFSVPSSIAQTRLRLYDQLGVERAVLFDERAAVGEHVVALSMEELPSGVYYCRLDAGGTVLAITSVVKQ